MSIKTTHRSVRLTAILLIVSFATTQLVFSEPNVHLLSLPSDITSETKTFHDLIIPEEIGRIYKSHINPGIEQNQTLIHIRDAHGSLEAQQSIQKLIQLFAEELDVKTVFVEGAQGKLNPRTLQFFKNSEMNSGVLDELTKSGELSGAELYLAAHSESGIKIFGAESLDAYTNNFKIFRSVLNKKSTSASFIRKFRLQIEKRGSKIFNKTLKEFVKFWQAWREEKLPITGFLSSIQKLSLQVLDLDLQHAKSQKEFPMLVRYFKARAIDSELQIEKAKIEKEKLLVLAKSNQVSSQLISWLEAWDLEKGFSGFPKEVQPRAFLESVYEALGPAEFQFQDYPELIKVWTAVAFQNELEALPLFEEVDVLTNQLFMKLAQTPAEKKMVALIHDSILLEKLFNLELSREEFEEIKKRQDELKTFTVLYRLSDLGDEVKILQQMVRAIDQIFSEAIKFYEGALAREVQMEKNISAILKESGETKAVLITGGFHSEGFEKAFIKNRYAYLEINPKISSVEGAQKSYLDSMLGKRVTIFDRAQISLPVLSQEPKAREAIWVNVGKDAQLAVLFNHQVIQLGGRAMEDLLPEIESLNQNPIMREAQTKYRWIIAKDEKNQKYLLLQSKREDEVSSIIAFPFVNGVLNVDRPIEGVSLERFTGKSPAQSKVPQTNNLASILSRLGLSNPGAEPPKEGEISRMEALKLIPVAKSELRNTVDQAIPVRAAISIKSLQPEQLFAKTKKRVIEILRTRKEQYGNILKKYNPIQYPRYKPKEVEDLSEHFEKFRKAEYWTEFVGAEMWMAELMVNHAITLSEQNDLHLQYGPYWQLNQVIQHLEGMAFDPSIYLRSTFLRLIDLIGTQLRWRDDYEKNIFYGLDSRDYSDRLSVRKKFIDNLIDEITRISPSLESSLRGLSDSLIPDSKAAWDVQRNNFEVHIDYLNRAIFGIDDLSDMMVAFDSKSVTLTVSNTSRSEFRMSPNEFLDIARSSFYVFGALGIAWAFVSMKFFWKADYNSKNRFADILLIAFPVIGFFIVPSQVDIAKGQVLPLAHDMPNVITVEREAPVETAWEISEVDSIVNLDLLIQNVEHIELEKVLERTREVAKFLTEFEPFLSPDFASDEVVEKEQNLVTGYLIIWLMENPRDELFQKSDGPALGPEQIELVQARELLRRLMVRAKTDSSVRTLFEKILDLEQLKLLHDAVTVISDGRTGHENLSVKQRKLTVLRTLISQNRNLQLLSWRLFINENAREIPGSTKEWVDWYGARYNTSYFLDVVRSNQGEEDLGRKGLALPPKAEAVARFVDAYLIHLIQILNNTSEDLAQFQETFAGKWKDLDELAQVDPSLTRALRIVRDIDRVKNSSKKEKKKQLALLNRLGAQLVKIDRRIDVLKQREAVGFSGAEWQRFVAGRAYVKDQIDKKRRTLINEIRGRSELRSFVEAVSAIARNFFRWPRREQAPPRKDKENRKSSQEPTDFGPSAILDDTLKELLENKPEEKSERSELRIDSDMKKLEQVSLEEIRDVLKTERERLFANVRDERGKHDLTFAIAMVDELDPAPFEHAADLIAAIDLYEKWASSIRTSTHPNELTAKLTVRKNQMKKAAAIRNFFIKASDFDDLIKSAGTNRNVIAGINIMVQTLTKRLALESLKQKEKRSELRLVSEKTTLSVAEVLGYIASVGSHLTDVLVTSAIAAESVPKSELRFILSEPAKLAQLLYSAQMATLNPGQVKQQIPNEVTFSAEGDLVKTILMGLMKDIQFLEEVQSQNLRIVISDPHGQIKSQIKGVLESFKDPVQKASAGGIISNFIRISKDPLANVVQKHSNSAVFVESDEVLEEIAGFGDIFIAFADWSNVQDPASIAQMFVPLAVGAADLARAFKIKNESEIALLKASLRDLGFIFDGIRGQNVATLALSVIEAIYDDVRRQAQFAKSA